MAGHSHSANIRYRKDRVNAAKAKAFSKIARMITVAAKLGGGDADSNPRLRLAMDKARVVSMPKDNIERAIKKGTGDASVGDYEEILYEGYAPGGVAVMLEILTDKRTRTAPEIRRIFERSGGNLGSSGSVAWMFERKAVILVSGDGIDEEQLFEAALEAGAEDVEGSGTEFAVRCEPGDFESVKAALETAGAPVVGGEVSFLPQNVTVVEALDEARRVVRCIDQLEEHDDVQTVYANYEFSDEILAELTKGA